MGSQWPKMGCALMKLPICENSIRRSHETLLPKGLDLIGLITSPDPKVYDNILHAFVGIAAIQIALVDLLFAIGIEPDGIVGHSVGELGCSYADKCLTADQVILAAYARGKASNDAKLIKGLMAAVGKSYKDIKDEIPEGIEVACHNSSTSCTLSGPAEILSEYVKKLQENNIFARTVNVANIAYHSKYIVPAAPYLLEYLKEIIPNPVKRSSKWVSSSVEEAKWDTELAQYCSAEYHTNNLLSYVLFEEASSFIPKKAITIEIAPHGLLQAILKRSLTSCTNVSLTNRAHKDGIAFLQNALGSLFNEGVDMNLTKLITDSEKQPVKYPLHGGLSYIHPLITWDHSETWMPESLKYEVKGRDPNLAWRDITYPSTEDEILYYMSSNIIASKGSMPYTKILVIIIEIMNEKIHRKSTLDGAFIFENVEFHNYLELNKESEVNLQLLYQLGSGQFETLSEDVPIMNCVVKIPQKPNPSKPFSNYDLGRNITSISSSQIYSYFEEKGHSFLKGFKNVVSVTITENGFRGWIKYTGNIMHYLDGILKLATFYFSLDGDTINEIYFIREFIVDLNVLKNEEKVIEVSYHNTSGLLICDGVIISSIRSRPNNNPNQYNLKVGSVDFLPHGTMDMPDHFQDIASQLIEDAAFSPHSPGKVTIFSEHNLEHEISDVLNYTMHIKIERKLLDMDNLIAEAKEIGIYRKENDVSLIILEKHSLETITSLVGNKNNTFILHRDSTKKKGAVQGLSLLLEQHYDSYKLSLYKKVGNKLITNNFINALDNSTNWESKLPKQNLIQRDSYFVVFKYDLFADISEKIEKLSSRKDYQCIRLVFLDDSAPPFNISSPFYKTQLVQDLKINVCFKNQWGTLRNIPVGMSTLVDDSVQNSSNKYLANIKCSSINLQYVGLNLKDVVYPNDNSGFGVVEYCGERNRKLHFGLGQLNEDDTLIPDPILHWEIPESWTKEDAVTVPLCYTMAYYIMIVKTKDNNGLFSSVFVHCGHSLFGQAFINVALSYKSRVFTSCMNQEQKDYILSLYPQLDKDDIFLINEITKTRFQHDLYERTGGEGVNIVVNCWTDPKHLHETLFSVSFKGRYFHMGHPDETYLRHLGMGVFMKETGVYGVSPDVILKSEDKIKQRLMQLVKTNIEQNKIKPLPYKYISAASTRTQAQLQIQESCRSDRPQKILLDTSVKNKSVKETLSAIENDINKIFIIIGGYNSLWFDILHSLVVRGARKLYVLVKELSIPEYVKRRYNNLIKKYTNANIVFNTSGINTPESCNEFFEKFQNGSSIDTVFFITPGLEKKVLFVDNALRQHCKSCNLICLGPVGDRVCESRQRDGFKGLSLILKKSSIRNRAVLNVLESVNKLNINKPVITIDEIKQLTDYDLISYLPSNVAELVQLGEVTSDVPCFTEVMTMTVPYSESKGIDPVFIIPGFKVNKLKAICSKMFYPTFIAKFSLKSSTIDEVGSKLAKELMDNFRLNMFTIVAETWSGALALSIVKYLELNGKKAEIIMIDAAPKTIQDWSHTLSDSENVIDRFFSVENKGNISELKECSDSVTEMMQKYSKDNWTLEELRTGMDSLLSQLEAIATFPEKPFKLNAKIHIFRPDKMISNESCGVDEFSRLPVGVHYLPCKDLNAMLESDILFHDVNSLVLLEYRQVVGEQDVSVIATLDLLLDAKYQTEGLTRT